MTSRLSDASANSIAGARGTDEINEASVKLHFRAGRRLPVIRQNEAAECGLACLAMILSYYGHEADLPSLRQRFSLSLKGVTLARLMSMGQSLGLAARPLRLELDELGKLQQPCILHWNLNHFVVLRKVSKRSITIHDPAFGERVIPLTEVGKHFSGVALELSKGPDFQRKSAATPVSLRSLAGSIHGLGRALATIFGLALVLELFGLLAPQFMQMVVDQVLADGDHDLLTFLGLSFCLLILLQTVVTAMRSWTVIWLGTHLNLNWTGNVFQHLMRLPQEYFLKRHLGDIVSRFGAIDVIQQTLTTQFVSVILDGLLATLTLGVMLAYSPILTGLSVMTLAVYVGLRLLYYRVYRESNLNQIVATARQQSRFMESVRAVQTIRLFNYGSAQTGRYLNSTVETLNTSVGVQRLTLLFNSLASLTGGAQRVGVLWLGASLAMGGQFSAGMLVAFVAYADQFISRGSSLVDYLIQLRLVRLQGERLADIVMTAPEPYTEGLYSGPTPEPSIQFENVSFRYADGEPWVLKDCNLAIEAGSSVAITGPSGCGKSTLVRLMLGLLDPQEGRVLVGGVDIRSLGKRAYRELVASVMQDDALMAGSVAENISLFDEKATPEVTEKAARLAELHGDIVAMPMGYYTLVGDMGSSLSGGQRQRLLLARALYRDPQILVLDEGTSHLDIACERRIVDTLRRFQMTRVLIAHRPETIASAETVITLQPHFGRGNGPTQLSISSNLLPIEP